MKLTDHTTYADAQKHFSIAKLWELFDGDKSRLNIAHECIDRHAGDPKRVAVRIAHADGRDEILTFRQIADASAQVAYDLAARGVVRGDRVAIMLEPGLAFYAGLFGAIKRGAVAVPLFMLFGPDGLRLRIDDCQPRVLLTTADKAPIAAGFAGLDTVICDGSWLAALQQHPTAYAWKARPTISPASNIRPGRRGRCPRQSITRTAPSSWC
jgi:acetyl-CoA synthetase